MIFCHILRVVGVLTIMLGLWLIFAGIAYGDDPALLARYLGSRNPGEYIDKGIFYFVVGSALGACGSVGLSILRRNKDGASYGEEC